LKQLGVPVPPELARRGATLLCGCWSPVEADLGEGISLGYGGLGVVSHKDVRAGRHCLLSQQVTLGGRSGKAGIPARLLRADPAPEPSWRREMGTAP